jgi:hypothetical protein
MDQAPRADTGATVELGAAAVLAPSMNGYGQSGAAAHSDALMYVGIAFLAGLLLAGLVSRLGS